MSTTTIIAISRQFGSGGARVGRAVAQRLGFAYADREILAEAARRLELQPEELEPLEERTAGFWARVGMLFAHGSPDTPFIAPTLPSVSEAQLFAVERQVMARIAERGNAVIVGRGAAHVVEGPGRVIRVFLHAPLDARIDLAMAEYGLADRGDAARIVAESDHARAQFVRDVTGHDWCAATLYDISLNTAAFGLERVVDLIVEVVQRPTAAPLPPIAPRAADIRDSQ